MRVVVALVILLAACASPAAVERTASPQPTPRPAASGAPQTTPAATGPCDSPTIEPCLAASFGEEGELEFAIAVVAWNGRFVAVGHHFDSGYIGPPSSARAWSSSDGRRWVEQPLDLGTQDVSLVGIAPVDDGRLLLVGVVGANPPYTEPEAPPARTAAWTSDDALTWQEVDLGLPNSVVANSFAFGPMGYALSTGTQLWHSADGLGWTLAHDAPEEGGFHDVVAGDEGFVARGYISPSGGALVLASGDGQTWYEAPSLPGGGALDVTSLDGDWLALAFEADSSTISVWWSANGLDWTRTIDVNDLTGPDGPKAGRGMESGITGGTLASAGRRAYLTLTWNHCCAQMAVNVGVWTSVDGAAWSPVVLEGGLIQSVALGNNVAVLAGHIGRGARAAFWIMER
jgi:hypothetical protein